MSKSQGKRSKEEGRELGAAHEQIGEKTAASHPDAEASRQSYVALSDSEESWRDDRVPGSESISSEASATKVCIENPDPEGVYEAYGQRSVWIRPPHHASSLPVGRSAKETDVWPQGLWASNDMDSQVRVLAFVGSRAWREGLRRSVLLPSLDAYVHPIGSTGIEFWSNAPESKAGKHGQDYDEQAREFLNSQVLSADSDAGSVHQVAPSY